MRWLVIAIAITAATSAEGAQGDAIHGSIPHVMFGGKVGWLWGLP